MVRGSISRPRFVARLRPEVRDREMHEQSRHHKINQRRDEQREEGRELHHTFLPDHECGDIAKGTEGTAGIGADDDIDAAQTDKTGVGTPYGEYHGTHQQRGRQVVCHR